MKLGQAKLIRSVNNNSVNTGNIDTCFNNRGAHKNVVFLVVEVRHDVLQLFLTQLTMPDCHSGLRHQLSDSLGCSFDRADLVVQIIDLPTTQQLSEDRFLDEFIVTFTDKGLDG